MGINTSASQQISKLTGISPPGRTSQPPSPAPSPPCVADDARYDALLANAGADYPLVRNTWPVPSQLISMSSFMSPFRCTLQSDVGAAKPLLCPRRPATVGHRRPATGPDIDADELLRQRTCLFCTMLKSFGLMYMAGRYASPFPSLCLFQSPKNLGSNKFPDS